MKLNIVVLLDINLSLRMFLSPPCHSLAPLNNSWNLSTFPLNIFLFLPFTASSVNKFHKMCKRVLPFILLKLPSAEEASMMVPLCYSHGSQWQTMLTVSMLWILVHTGYIPSQLYVSASVHIICVILNTSITTTPPPVYVLCQLTFWFHHFEVWWPEIISHGALGRRVPALSKDEIVFQKVINTCLLPQQWYQETIFDNSQVPCPQLHTL